jgi:membrane-associated phospholipid phosphatase
VPAHGERFFTNPRSALALGVALLALVALAAVLVPATPLAIERAWREAMSDAPSAFLKDVALVFNWLGRGVGRGLAIAVIAIVLLVRRRLLAALAFGVAVGISSLLSALLKAAVGRPRPPDGLVHPLGASFPSGHATYAGATCVALVLLFTLPGPRRRRWWLVSALVVAAMGWSRTYLQVHWLLDVVAGGFLGTGVSLVVFAAAMLYSPLASLDRVALSWGKSSSRNSPSRRAPRGASSSSSRRRSSTLRIFPEIVFGSSANSSRRTRL